MRLATIQHAIYTTRLWSTDRITHEGNSSVDSEWKAFHDEDSPSTDFRVHKLIAYHRPRAPSRQMCRLHVA